MKFEELQESIGKWLICHECGDPNKPIYKILRIDRIEPSTVRKNESNPDAWIVGPEIILNNGEIRIWKPGHTLILNFTIEDAYVISTNEFKARFSDIIYKFLEV